VNRTSRPERYADDKMDSPMRSRGERDCRN
jgi:hypothetical protein